MSRQPERVYRDLFVRDVRGSVPEVWLGFGRVDIVTWTEVVEVESITTWRSGVRQALAYSAMTPYHAVPKLTPAVALFGELSAERAIGIYVLLRDRGISLYLFNGSRWERVSSRRAASRRWHLLPAIEPVPFPAMDADDIDQAARLLDVGRRTVQRVVARGELVRPITRDALASWLDGLPSAARP